MKRLFLPIDAFGGVCLALLLLTPLAGAQENHSDRLGNVPTFESTSRDSVLLRYKPKAGNVEKVAMDTEMEMRIHLGGQEFKTKQSMRIEAKTAVTAVDAEGNFSSVMKITRLYLKMSGGPTNVEFDTDKPSDNPDFKAVTAMINVGIPCKMSAVGKILETDLEPLRLAARRAENAALSKSLEDSTKQMFEGTYIQLSESPVKAGDIYKAGTIVSDKIKIHNSYKIRSVSEDKTKVVLELAPVLEIATGAFPEGLETKVKSQKVSGWILFDVQKGYASKADGRMQMVLDINAMGQTGTVEITARSQATASLE